MRGHNGGFAGRRKLRDSAELVFGDTLNGQRLVNASPAIAADPVAQVLIGLERFFEIQFEDGPERRILSSNCVAGQRVQDSGSIPGFS